MERLVSILGLAVLIGIAVLLSNNRRRINRRLVATGLALQWIFALLILRTAPGKLVFPGARLAIAKLLGFTAHGPSFLFGNLYRGVDGVVECQTDEKFGNVIMDKFRAKGIPVIAIHIPLPGATYFGADNYQAGRLRGQGPGGWGHGNRAGQGGHVRRC